MNEVDEHGRSDRRREIGEVFDGRFEITGRLGAGGFATVYAATQLNLEQPVAIKVLDVRTDEPEIFLERFLREAKTAAAIRHPDIVRIIDFGSTHGGDPFIVLELLDGLNLEEELQRSGAMEPERAHRLFVRCLDALQAAHAQGVVHRDLKPANLFLCQAGTLVETLRILDFGIAHVVEGEAERLTGTGQLLGTPAYLPPEYIEAQTISPALDVYQMALIFVQMLTGESVVRGKNLYQSLMAHCSGELDIPVDLIASPVGKVIGIATSLDPERRYRDAGEFRDALAAIDPTTIPRVSDQAPEPSAEGFAATLDFVSDEIDPPHLTTETGDVPAASSAGRRVSVWIALAGSAVAILLVVLAIFGAKWTTAPHRDSAPPRAPLGPVAAPAAPDPPPVDVAPQAVSDESDREPPVKIPTIPVAIRVSPSTARIYVDEDLVGTGSVSLEFAGPSDSPKTMKVVARGFVTRVVSVAPNDRDVDLTLIRKKRPRPSTTAAGEEVAAKAAPAPRALEPVKAAAPAADRQSKLGFIEEDSKTKMGMFE